MYWLVIIARPLRGEQAAQPPRLSLLLHRTAPTLHARASSGDRRRRASTRSNARLRRPAAA
eukprot:4614025-Pleurochrysis_carterae.AAC.1